jgi:hypothetical protein
MVYLGVGVIAVAGWFLGTRFRKFAHYFSRSLLVFLAALFLAVSVVGFLRIDAPDSVHRILGHLFVIATYLTVPFVIGFNIAQFEEIGSTKLFALIAVLLALLLIIGVESFTGYLGPTSPSPTPDESVNAETTNRFVVLHLYFLPTLIAVLLGTSFWLTRQVRTNETIPANDTN